ncbi:MAG: cation-translocating P-type ATPase [Candidatus Aenigmatarchaeota archaeon]
MAPPTKCELCFHTKSAQEALEMLDSCPNGLSEEEAAKRLEQFGPNELPEKKGTHPAIIFLKQFKSILIYILLIAAGISYVFGHMIDVYVILGVVLINACMGFVQEYRAEKSINALKNMIVPRAKVYRGGELIQIEAKDLVCGDVILLEEGDKIPADARIIESKNLRCVESSLTGESLPIDKFPKQLPEKTPLADMKNMVWMGTFVASGQATVVVTATGIRTSIGKIAKEIQNIRRTRSHFEKKTDLLAKQMGLIAAAGASVIFITGYFFRGIPFEEIFVFTLASLVSAIPEGLPAVLVVVLAIGSHRMAKRNAIIRTLPATETLGVVTAIITDKTGTLTENTMNAERIVLSGEGEISVSGRGWIPSGEFRQSEKIIIPLESSGLSKILHIGAVCNNAKLFKKENEENYSVLGDPTEAALLVLAEKAGLKKEVVHTREGRIDDMPFSPERRYRASLVKMADGGELEIYAVGAPEKILRRSTHVLRGGEVHELTRARKDEIEENMGRLTRSAMRVIALAYRKTRKKENELSDEDVSGLVFVGLAGLRDPIKQGVREAVEKAKTAGIRVIMATGDHKETALAVAKEIGLVDSESGPPKAFSESELLKMTADEFGEAVGKVSVFARLTPTMKLKIAESLQAQGHTIAMTGDGINDAPALKKADIGIAMGVIGTDVARESSEIILADDNFASIVSAIEEGRIVFRNTRQSSSFLITTNFAEQATILSTLFMGLPLPLSAIQILWLNLVTDGVSDITLATEPGHNEALNEPPKNAKEGILSKEILPFLFVMSATMVAATLLVYLALLPLGEEMARTGAFAVMAFTQLFNVLNMRSLKKSVFEIGIFSNRYVCASLVASVSLMCIALYNPFLQGIFRFSYISPVQLFEIALLSSSVLWLGEFYKRLKKMVSESRAI